jgi:hypothetical protein
VQIFLEYIPVLLWGGKRNQMTVVTCAKRNKKRSRFFSIVPVIKWQLTSIFARESEYGRFRFPSQIADRGR